MLRHPVRGLGAQTTPGVVSGRKRLPVSFPGVVSGLYDRQVARGKHHGIALSHVAHKMLHVIFSVLKNDRPYTPMLN